MAKKAQAKKAQATTVKKTTAKKTTAQKKTAAKNDGALAAAAKRVGRTLGRGARGIDKVKAVIKKSVAGKRGPKKPKIDPEVEAAKARTRAAWKSQAKEATSVELAKHGTLVDERARVRSTMGMSWSNRKPR